MNLFPDAFRTVTDRSLFRPDLPHGMNTLTRWLTNSGCVAQALSSSNHSSTVGRTTMSAISQQLRSDLGVAGTSDALQHRPPLPKLDIPAVDAVRMRNRLRKWEVEDDVKGGPLDLREVKTAREKEIEYLWDMEVYEYSTEAEARARTGCNPVGLKWIDTNKGSAEAHVPVRVSCVRRCVIKVSSRQHFRWKVCESYSVLHVKKVSESRTFS